MCFVSFFVILAPLCEMGLSSRDEVGFYAGRPPLYKACVTVWAGRREIGSMARRLAF